MLRLPCVIMRGGTSKAIVFAAQALPDDPIVRDQAILGAFGSPDLRQIDGLGGADPLTSKVAIVAPSARDDADIDYTFGQVAIASPSINYKVSCGNTAAAVAVYAIEEGIVSAVDGWTEVRIFCRNNDKLIVGEVPTRDGTVVVDGDYRISGVSRAGAEIRLRFLDPAGGVTGRLLPTGACVDEVEVGGRKFVFSLVDCGNLYAILPAESLSLTGVELPEDIDTRPGLKALVEDLRETIAEKYILRSRPGDTRSSHAAKVKVAVVGPPVSHRASDGSSITADAFEIVARIINQERTHKAFAVTGAICLAAAARTSGTTANVLRTRADSASSATVRLAHPQGIIEPRIDIEQGPQGTEIRSVQIGRTARRIMEGVVYVPEVTS